MDILKLSNDLRRANIDIIDAYNTCNDIYAVSLQITQTIKYIMDKLFSAGMQISDSVSDFQDEYYTGNKYADDELKAQQMIMDSFVPSEEFDLTIQMQNDDTKDVSDVTSPVVKKVRFCNRSTPGEQYFAIKNIIMSLRDKEIVKICVISDNESEEYKYAMFDMPECIFKTVDDDIYNILSITQIFKLSKEDQEILKEEFGVV